MDTIERRALYNLLRMNWLKDSTLQVEEWQVEDYQSLRVNELFERLSFFNIYLDKASFVSYAEDFDSPEDLSDAFTADKNLPPVKEDQIYLLIFELWRRLMVEKPSLSIVCHELDNQIQVYDQGNLEQPEKLQSALDLFLQALSKNTDQGIPPDQAISLIASYCANDIETFLFDYLSEQIDQGNELYASEMIEEFKPYLQKNRWFKLLQLRVCEHMHSKIAQKIAEEILEDYLTPPDLEFNFEFLSILAEKEDFPLYAYIIKETYPLLKIEMDFKDLLAISMDFFRLIDKNKEESLLHKLFEKRSEIPQDQPLSSNDPDLENFIKIFS